MAHPDFFGVSDHGLLSCLRNHSILKADRRGCYTLPGRGSWGGAEAPRCATILAACSDRQEDGQQAWLRCCSWRCIRSPRVARQFRCACAIRRRATHVGSSGVAHTASGHATRLTAASAPTAARRRSCPRRRAAVECHGRVRELPICVALPAVGAACGRRTRSGQNPGG